MNDLNVFGGQSKEMSVANAATAIAATKQAQEVQARMVVAKRFPRDEEKSMERILNACTRKTLAESAIYSYPRGGQEVTGPSIRLAECIAQNWGNIEFGYTELEQRQGESTVEAFAWDLETNTRQSKIFTVQHKRDKKGGGQALTESRDIYELVANQASRRVRSCVLAIIPGDVVDAAVQQCELTMKGGTANNGMSLDELITDMILHFANYGVTEEMLCAYIGKNIEAFNEKDVVKLRKVYTSLKDGIVGNDYFINRMKDSAAELQQKQEEAVKAIGAKDSESTAKVEGKTAKEGESAGKESESPEEVGFDDL